MIACPASQHKYETIKAARRLAPAPSRAATQTAHRSHYVRCGVVAMSTIAHSDLTSSQQSLAQHRRRFHRDSATLLDVYCCIFVGIFAIGHSV